LSYGSKKLTTPARRLWGCLMNAEGSRSDALSDARFSPEGRIQKHAIATVAASAAASAKQVVNQPKKLPPPNTDFYELADDLSGPEKATVKNVPTYIETKVKPVINKYWADDAFPTAAPAKY
jgi:hypothetical protein